jgi:hypothetical protein
MDKSNFGALMNKLTPNQKNRNNLNTTYTKEDASAFSSPCTVTQGGDVRSIWSTANNTVLDESIVDHHEQEQERLSQQQRAENDEADNDNRILYEFIDEMFSIKSNNANEAGFDQKNNNSLNAEESDNDQQNEYEYESDDEDDDDLSQLSSLLRQQPKNSVRLPQPIYIQELPKIDEDFEEEDEEQQQPEQQTQQKSLPPKTMTTKKLTRPAPVIQMTKTARLRQASHVTSHESFSFLNSSKKPPTNVLVKENKPFHKPGLASNSKAPPHLAGKKPSTAKPKNANSEFAQSNKSANVNSNNTKYNSVLTTVNIHSNTFNFNYNKG